MPNLRSLPVSKHQKSALRLAGFAAITATSVLLSFAAPSGSAKPIAKSPKPAPDYARDIRPILARNCFSCHGADDGKRQAGLRLDTRSGAIQALKSGGKAIVPGKPANSGLMKRITTTSAATLMPPPETGHKVTADEAKTLSHWISSGAKYVSHWAFSKPVAAPVTPGAHNPIDPLVNKAILENGLTPVAAADRRTWLRRVALDLTGIPPTLADVRAFEADKSPNAKEKIVDKLLASKHFGEKWARPWLDLARYADSAGYGSDPLRTNLWPWRDWVIDSLNRNIPYDQFVTLQLAGDIIPGATDDTRLATAFHRNTMTNTEGGTSDEEFRTAAVKDRIQTTVQGLMGITVQCAQCHTHKFDPISQREYYQLLAVFNQTMDNDQPDESPLLAVTPPSRRDLATQLDARIKDAEAKLAAKPQTIGNTGTRPARFIRITQPGASTFLMLAEVEVISAGKNITVGKQASQSSTDYAGPAKLAIDGNPDGNFDHKSTTHTASQDNPWWEVDLGSVVSVDSVRIHPRTDAHVGKMKGIRITLLDADRKPVAEATVADAIIAARETIPSGDPDRIALADLRAQRAAIGTIRVPVMVELAADKQRTSTMLTLGNFQMKGDAVQPSVPAAFGKLPAGAPLNRLGVAKWLFNRDNPLTARVAVNRIWAQLFGRGIVETEEDFGIQGALPTNQALLDQLAVMFMHDWDVKELIREIVLTDTYGRTSLASPLAERRDPRNIHLSHYPRRRLDAEGVRDQSLTLSGMLTPTIGGPSVYPPQPDGLWQAAFNGERNYPTSMGADRYRRGLYTFWRRTVPYPSMATFDAPSREACTLRRQPTNTPLQALVTLNDPAYIEFAQGFAIRVLTESKGTDRQRAAWALENATLQKPTSKQIDAVVALLTAERSRLSKDMESAKQLADPAAHPLPKNLDIVDAAAWTVTSNVILNLDQVLTIN
jgi:mono/diheme cytochrome c family protein